MKEKVLIQIFAKNGEYITSQDVSGFNAAQVDEMIAVKEEHGLECRVRRVLFNEEAIKANMLRINRPDGCTNEFGKCILAGFDECKNGCSYYIGQFQYRK